MNKINHVNGFRRVFIFNECRLCALTRTNRVKLASNRISLRNMDWAKLVKTTRKRLNLNQEGLADLLGVSQTTVSRLESGMAIPTDDIREKLQTIRQDPRTRSVFDDFVASIEHSPYASFLAQAEDGRFRLEAVSRELKSSFALTSSVLNEVAGTDALIMHLEALIRRGFDAGRIESAVGVWTDCLPEPGYWRIVYSPMRDGTGSWFIFAAMMKTSEADFESHHAEHDGGLAITTYQQDGQV